MLQLTNMAHWLQDKYYWNCSGIKAKFSTTASSQKVSTNKWDNDGYG